MNEIRKCSIAGVSFTLETDAYDVLSTYIDTLNDTYKDDPDGEEIVADIEARIAELILSAQTAEAVICRPLIDNIIKQLGSVSQIDEEHTEQPHSHADTTDHNGNPRIPRRLYRDLQHNQLGGVCAGLANYFDVDPVLIRLAIFAPLLLNIFGFISIFHWIRPFTGNLFGIFVLGYIIMWFAIPPASSARQKLEMKGERITAKSIKDATQPAPEPERKLIAKIFTVLGNILLIILKIFVVFLLIGLIVGTSLLSLVAVCSLSLFAFNFSTGLSLLCFLLALILPLAILIYLSILLLITRRPNGKFLLGAFIVWILLLVGTTVTAIKSPVDFGKQIRNTFESVFSKKAYKLYEEFSDKEIDDFRKELDRIDTAVISNGALSITLSGDDGKVDSLYGSVKIDDKSITITDGQNNTLRITDDGATINGNEVGSLTFDFGGVNTNITLKAKDTNTSSETSAEPITPVTPVTAQPQTAEVK